MKEERFRRLHLRGNDRKRSHSLWPTQIHIEWNSKSDSVWHLFLYHKPPRGLIWHLGFQASAVQNAFHLSLQTKKYSIKFLKKSKQPCHLLILLICKLISKQTLMTTRLIRFLIYEIFNFCNYIIPSFLLYFPEIHISNKGIGGLFRIEEERMK